MFLQFFSIGLIMLVSVMLPGPDFALVTKNTILHSRRAGLFTSLGVVSAVVIHMTYCLLGLAVIIANSLVLFTVIKYVGASYLIYIGMMSFLAKKHDITADMPDKPRQKTDLRPFIAFRQGFLCNLLNPKATLFFLALFTVIIKPGTPLWMQVGFAIEQLILAGAWFTALTIMLSHPRILNSFNKVEIYIEKSLGVLLILFGVALAFVRR